jgi:hypothetical protein
MQKRSCCVLTASTPWMHSACVRYAIKRSLARSCIK